MVIIIIVTTAATTTTMIAVDFMLQEFLVNARLED